MRRVAVVSDVHGNLAALEAVLAETSTVGVDAIVSAGDVVSGPFPRECLALLADAGALWVRGNADRGALDGGPHPADAWTAERLDDADRALLRSFAPTVRLEVDDLGAVLVCHGTPRSDEEILTPFSPPARVRAALAGVPEAVVVGGHVHRQDDRRIDRWRIVNAGSVGRPYEGRPGAYWALLGPDVDLRRTSYDIEAAAARIRASGYPDAEEELRESLLAPLDPDEVSREFERRATASDAPL